MGRENTGKPQLGTVIDLETGRSLSIPSNFVTGAMLADNARTSLGLAVGVYGTSKYGDCKYGINYGIYGTSVYGDSSYA